MFTFARKTHFIEFSPFGILAVVICMSVALTYELQQRLRISERRYRLLFENSPFSVHELDLTGRFLSMNRAGLAMLGQQDDRRIAGTTFLSTVSEQESGRIREIFKEAINGEEKHFEFVLPATHRIILDLALFPSGTLKARLRS